MALVASLAVAGTAQALKLPLLPLARGHVRVLLGAQPYWMPVSGRTTLTLLAGPATRRQKALNAYIALHRAGQSCAASAKGDTASKLTFTSFFSGANVLPPVNPLAPNGGGERGVAAASEAVTVRQRGTVRACVWLAKQPATRTRAIVQQIPLLDGLFAASVAALPAGLHGAPTSFSLDGFSVGSGFRYRVTSTVCGASTTDQMQSVASETQATELVSIGSGNCPSDTWAFSFTTPKGRSRGSISYALADFTATPWVIGHLGACDLTGATATTLAAARAFVAGVGCRVGRVLTQPYDKAVPRGMVSMVQVDGGVAQIAPPGTTVDLVVDG